MSEASIADHGVIGGLRTAALAGNRPQACTHLGLIDAAITLERGVRR